MVRNVVAVFVGMVVGMVANMGLIFANMALFPAPPGLDFNDTEAMQAYIGALPATGFILPMVAHLMQAGLGGWVAARLGASRPVVLALIIGVVTLAGGLYNLMVLPGPWWMWVEVPLYLVVAWTVGGIEQARRERL